MTDVTPYRDENEQDPHQRVPRRFLNWIEELRNALRPVPDFFEGDGTPEGNVSARRGARYYNRTGAAGTFLYLKTTNGGNTGWIAYA